MVPVAPWRVCWGGLAHVPEFPNKSINHHTGVEFFYFLKLGFPGASLPQLQYTASPWLGTPREDRWRSLEDHFGIEGGPLGFNLGLLLQLSLHSIPSCTLCSSQSELLMLSVPRWPLCLYSGRSHSLECLHGRAEIFIPTSLFQPGLPNVVCMWPPGILFDLWRWCSSGPSKACLVVPTMN